MSIRRHVVFAVAIATLALAGSASGGARSETAALSGSSKAAQLPKVAVVLYGPAADGGWNTTWTAAVAQLKKSVPGVEVLVVPNINAGAQAQKTFMALGGKGYGLVVGTGGYGDTDFAKATAAYPKTQFVNLFGTKTGKNLAPFDIGIEDARYLDGVMAGLMTKSNVIGEVGGYPIPVEIRTLNAFARGVKSVNPKAKVKILWVNSFYDPAKERQAALALVGAGADILVMDSNTPAVSSVARAKNVKFIGYGISRKNDAPAQWLGSFSFRWAPYLVSWTRSIANSSYVPKLSYWGLPNKVVGQTPYGASVPASVKAQVAVVRQKIASGKLKVFAGPIKSNTGKTVVPAGKTLTTPQELSSCCSWYADNVDGNSSSG